MSERKVIAKKAYVAIVREHKILSSKSRTRQSKNVIVSFDQ